MIALLAAGARTGRGGDGIHVPPGVRSSPMAAQSSAAPVGEPGTAEGYLQVQTTTDSRSEAMELGRAAVEARLAACAQVAGPVASTYWWEGGIERAEEWQGAAQAPPSRLRALPRVFYTQ